ncbi:DUF917 family protein [Brevibacillus humidisoli]|uniref:DUF917 domain-containing protein n=1 Tax=Brevibacillus humidisoli TaxID=2895522 RepID=UPI001E59E59D|nr:DUF917 family protein [Brevibacillus humidisoli]UFJ39262.1 DUF917 family protein [Brevibacillus humidisoli]
MNKLNKLTREMIAPLLTGGCILGGGGGGSMAEGKKVAELAFSLGSPTLLPIEDLGDSDTVLTVSAVGAPAAPNQYVEPIDFARTVQTFTQYTGQHPRAMMTNENGGSASANGLLQSAVLGIPVLDAACNGRAHPTGVMGSIRLNELSDYRSVQVAIGGKPGTHSRVELAVAGTIDACSSMVRQAAVQAEGLVVVARNPVSGSYAKANAAVGAISHAIEVGQANLDGATPLDKVENVAKVLGGSVLIEGEVRNLVLNTINGFDLGGLRIVSGSQDMELTFWNEYMTVELGEQRLSTFPDLIMTFSAETGSPVTSAEIREGDRVFVIAAPYQNILLGSGMFVESNYQIVEKVLDKSIIPFIKPLFQ